MNAAINPITRLIVLLSIVKPVWKISIVSRRASPNIGTNTIRNENCAMFSFLLPSNRPVAIVVPERESPGSTAHA